MRTLRGGRSEINTLGQAVPSHRSRMNASRAWPRRKAQETVQVNSNGKLFGVAVGKPLHVNQVLRLIVAPRQTTQTSNKNRLALLSLRDNHPFAATEEHHPVCHASLIQL
jgi:hypothetical protein